jgi:hypothetical protein
VWIDCAEGRRVDDAGPAFEQWARELIAPAIGRLPVRPGMVIDARMAGAHGGPTATYRLLLALGLPSAAPVRISFARPDAAFDVLESLLSAAPHGDPALLATTTSRSPPLLAGCALVSRRPITARSVLGGRPASFKAGQLGDLLAELMLISEDPVISSSANTGIKEEQCRLVS